VHCIVETRAAYVVQIYLRRNTLKKYWCVEGKEKAMKRLRLAAFTALFFALVSCDFESYFDSEKDSDSEHHSKRNAQSEKYVQSEEYFQGNPQTSEAIRVGDIRSLPHNSRITLQGNLIQQLKKDYFLFRDESGEIAVEIEREVWTKSSLRYSDLRPTDRLIMTGKLEREKNKVEIEIKMICKVSSENNSGEPVDPNEPNKPVEPDQPTEPEQPIEPVKGWIVEFDLNGGTPAFGVDYSTQIVPYGEKMTMPKAPIKEGYVFQSWRETIENIPFFEDLSYPAWKDKVLKANWYPVYEVRFFDADGNVLASFSVIDEKGAFVDHPELTLPNFDKFRGWRMGKADGPSIPINGWAVKITSHTDFYPNYAN